MREFTNEDIKNVSLELVDQVDKFCKEHNLKYMLFFGTLLGAIRHNGFIPWDDDIDLAMPRDDYEYFIEHFGDERYGVVAVENSKTYYLPFAKVFDKKTLKIEGCAVKQEDMPPFNIDVFPLDYMDTPERYKELKAQQLKLFKKHQYSLRVFGKGFKNFLKSMYCLPYKGKAHKYSVKINDYMWIKNIERNYLVINEIFVTGPDYVFDKDIFDELVPHKFENREYLVPKKYDTVLTTCYGDYMTPPPEKERETHHDYKAYFVD